MQLKKYLTVALVASLLEVVTPIILVTTGATAATTALTLGVTLTNPALAAVGGAAVLLGAAGLIGLKAAAASRGRGGRGGRRRYRGKRAAEMLADDGYSVNAVEILFAAAGSLDQDTTCGLRLVCELAATPEQLWAPDEALLMSLFGSSAASFDSTDPATPFQVAEFLGRQSGSPEGCAKTYQKCGYNSTQIMSILRQNGIGQA